MITKKQIYLYESLWKKIKATKNLTFANGREERAARLAIHSELGLAESRNDWSNKDLDKWIEATAPMREEIDLRDRSHERVIFQIEKLATVCAWVRRATGFEEETWEEYVYQLALDLWDCEWTSLPLTSTNHRDLSNLRNLLRNRVSGLCSRIRGVGRKSHRQGELLVPDGWTWPTNQRGEEMTNDEFITSLWTTAKSPTQPITSYSPVAEPAMTSVDEPF